MKRTRSLGGWSIFFTILCPLGLGSLFVALPHILSVWIGRLVVQGRGVDSIPFHLLLDGMIRVAFLTGYIFTISLRDSSRVCVFEYHGAEQINL
nr:DUF1385 domain-containing protein [Desulfobacterales bacterium]